MGWNHPRGNVTGISATPQKTNMSPNINGWKMHFNSPFCCRHLSFRGCFIIARVKLSRIAKVSGHVVFPQKTLATFGRLGSGNLPPPTPTSPMEEDALMVGLTECLQMGATNLQVGEYGGCCCLGLGEKSVCLHIHKSFQESQRLTT